MSCVKTKTAFSSLLCAATISFVLTTTSSGSASAPMQCPKVTKCAELCDRLQLATKTRKACVTKGAERSCDFEKALEMKSYYAYVGCGMYHDSNFRSDWHFD
jgi:hypothetical protein